MSSRFSSNSEALASELIEQIYDCVYIVTKNSMIQILCLSSSTLLILTRRDIVMTTFMQSFVRDPLNITSNKERNISEFF